MDATPKDIAALLRSTEPMATQFAQRVQDRVGQPVSYDEVLAAMQKIAATKLSLETVVAKVLQERQKQSRRRASRRQTTPPEKPHTSRTTDVAPSKGVLSKKPGTILEQLHATLRENWDRAEAEGLSPNRMSAEAFVSEVYQHTDRREATRRRILQAARRLDQDDVLLTPALVADAAHELFKG